MKDLKLYMLKGVLLVSVLGTLLHFAYSWSGENLFVGIFTPINESIWEHTKLLFFPMLIYSVFLSFKIGKKYPCISSSMILGELIGILSIIVLFYTYSGTIGFHVAALDISIFYISVLLSFGTSYKSFFVCKLNKYNLFLKFIQIIIIFLFILFTFYPPNIPLFINPK